MKADSLTSKLVLSLFLSAGCSGATSGRGGGGGQGGIAQTGGGGQGGSAQAGSNGEAGGLGGQGTAGAGAGGAGGSTGGNGTAGDVAGAAGSSADASAAEVGSDGGQDGGGPSAGPFTCTMVLGLFTTSQWFNGTNPGGATKTFLQQDGIDATKWEGKLQKYSYVEKWADPANGVWKLPTQNACATDATSPDRVLFVGFSPDTKHDQPTIQALLEKVLTNIKTTYPTAKEIDLLTMGRAPGNMMCPNNSDADTL
ncbi:MAG TPA: hypothetical protein VH560_19720, partial [Polyangia bacterium]|nr:hypothetical protein [Polyangia bacterium]